MDGFTEKKWFVYLGDHHEGPFSLAEIQGKLTQGQVSRQSYVWAEGMSDWKVMTEVTEFESISSATKGSGGGAEVAGPILNVINSGTDSSNPNSDSPTLITELKPAVEEPSVPISLAPIDEASPVTVAEALPLESPAAESVEATRMTSSAEAVPITTLAENAEPQEGTATKLLKNQAAQGAKRPFPTKLVLLLLLAALGAGGYYADRQGILKLKDAEPYLQKAKALIADPALQSSLQNIGRSVTEFAQPALYEVIDRVPIVGEWISPIPALQGVSAPELAGLKKAALAKKSEAGTAAVADFAVGRADPLAPVLYVAANAPDGTPFEVVVDGVSDTLLNQTSFHSRLPVTLQKRFGQTLPLKQLDQRLIPRGEYTVAIVPAGAMPGTVAPLATRTVFLGGVKDATYSARLKEYHDRLRDKARQELTELKQYAATLDSQLSSTVGSFGKFKKQRKGWSKFHDQWTKMQGQLEIVFSQWTPDRLNNEFFYSPLYALTQQAAQALTQVHGLHHGFFVGGAEAKSFEIQLGEATSGARMTLLQLKNKLEQAERLPPTPNGMPRRDGL